MPRFELLAKSERVISRVPIRTGQKPGRGAEENIPRLYRMPCSSRACRLESELFDGSLGTIFVFRTGDQVRWPVPPALACFFRVLLLRRSLAPRKTFFAGSEACEIAAAELAAVRCRAQPEPNPRPPRRPVVMFRPGAEVRAQAFRTTRVAPQRNVEDEGFKARVAFAAAKRKHSDYTFRARKKAVQPGVADCSCPALGTGAKSHKRLYTG